MKREGPFLETLTHRLAETPEDFLAEPRIGRKGVVETAAVVADVLSMLSTPVGASELQRFTGTDLRRDRNRLAVTLVLSWLLADEWFVRASPPADAVLGVLDRDAAELAGQVAAARLVSDPDRREEVVRMVLARFGYRPSGESEAQAQDRLTTLSSSERARVMKAARAAEERARSIREALVKKAAEESADKWTRE